MDRRQGIISSIIRIAARGGYTTICADESLSYSFDLILRNEDNIIVIVSPMSNFPSKSFPSPYSFFSFLKALSSKIWRNCPIAKISDHRLF